jgi:hypothetical protein
MTTSENRVLPMSAVAVAAMLVVSSTIIGLAWWVGDAIGPGFASIVQVSSRDAGAPKPPPVPMRLQAPPERAKNAPAAPAKHTEASVR